MNFSAVHGFNAYKQFTAEVRKTGESSKLQETQREQGIKHEKPTPVFGDPVDVVSISRTAELRFQSQAQSKALTKAPERESPQTTLKEWIKTSGNSIGFADSRVSSHASGQVSGQAISEMLKLNGVALEENEVHSIDMDVWCAVSVTERNAEKAKAIQNLLHTTPSGINWGFLLQKLPVD